VSIRVMTKVWDYSGAECGALLVLLAMADFANDDGIAWPSIASLCQKSRLAERIRGKTLFVYLRLSKNRWQTGSTASKHL